MKSVGPPSTRALILARQLFVICSMTLFFFHVHFVSNFFVIIDAIFSSLKVYISLRHINHIYFSPSLFDLA